MDEILEKENMGQKKAWTNSLIIIERVVYLLLTIFSLVITYYKPTWVIENTYTTVSLVGIIFYHFFLSNKIEAFCIHGRRYKEKDYCSINTTDKILEIMVDRRNDLWVIAIWLLYMSIMALLKVFDISLPWSLFLAGIFALLFLNNIFKYEFCIIRWIVYRKQINCCNDCHINGWDDFLIFSVLLFMPLMIKTMPWYNVLLVVVINILSLIHLISWEIGLYETPERYLPKTNDNLRCKNCKKGNCNGQERGKFNEKYSKGKYIGQRKEIKQSFERHYIIIGIIRAVIILLGLYFASGKTYFMKYYAFMIIFGFEMATWPTIYEWVKRKYRNLYEENIDKLIKFEKNNCNVFINEMFTLYNIKNIIIYVVALLFFWGLVFGFIAQDRIVLPDVDLWRKILFVFLFIINLITGCRAFVIFYNAFGQLKQIVQQEIKIDDYTEAYQYFKNIKLYTQRGILIIAIVFFTIIIGIMTGPLEESANLSKILISVLLLISLCPIILLVGAKYYLQHLWDRIKKQCIRKFDEHAITEISSKCKESIDYKAIREYVETKNIIEESISKKKDYSIVGIIGTFSLTIAELLTIFFGIVN